MLAPHRRAANDTSHGGVANMHHRNAVNVHGGRPTTACRTCKISQNDSKFAPQECCQCAWRGPTTPGLSCKTSLQGLYRCIPEVLYLRMAGRGTNHPRPKTQVCIASQREAATSPTVISAPQGLEERVTIPFGVGGRGPDGPGSNIVPGSRSPPSWGMVVRFAK